METKMSQDIKELVAEKIELTKQGLVVDAAERFYADNAESTDFTGIVTKGKSEMIDKMKSFTSGIQKVNGITFHNSAVDGNISFSEFTFDFDMADGSKILWHEIIKSEWKDDKIVREQFFTA